MAMTQHYTLGIDMGASSVKVVALGTGAVAAEGAGAGSAPAVLWSARRPHYGDPVACLRDLLAGMPAALAPEGCGGIAATGSGAGALAEAGAALPVLEDVPAIASGAQILAPEARSVIEIGGQNAYFVCRLAAAVPEFAMNESCASGTGSFFEDQMTRLGLRIEDFSALVGRAEGHEVPRISGRCAVFAKTDIIHRQQEGVPVEDILLGLCYAMVKSYKALIVRGLPVEAPVALSGGVLLNAGVVRAVREVFKLGEDGLIAREGNLFLVSVRRGRERSRRGTVVNPLALHAVELDLLPAQQRHIALGMGRDEHRAPAPLRQQKIDDAFLGHGVEAGEGLVEQQHPRRIHRRAGERHASPHAARELRDGPVERVFGQDPREQRAHPRPARPARAHEQHILHGR